MLEGGEEVTVEPSAPGCGVAVERLRVVEHVGAGGQGCVYRMEEVASPGEPRPGEGPPLGGTRSRGVFGVLVVLLGLGARGVGVQSCRGRPPPGAESTPAAVAPSATHSEDSSTVKNQKTPGKQNDKRKGLAVVLGCVGAACASSPQVVRSGPPPEECPPGSVQVMTEKLEVPLHEVWDSILDEGQSRRLPVSEGYAVAVIIEEFGNQPQRVRVSGNFYFGKDRVYGRFTEALLPNGELLPVCLEMWEEGKLGAEVMERGPKPGVVKIFSVVDLISVDRFE